MKRLLAFWLAVVLLLGMMPLLPEASVQAESIATVKGGWLKLRAATSTSSQVIGSYYTGTQVIVLETQNEWYNVITPDGNIGYMMAKFLTLHTDEGPDAPSPDTPDPDVQLIPAWVISDNGGSVRLRTGPGTSYGSINSYAVGTQAIILTPGATWHQVLIGNRTGYMMAKFLTTTPPDTPVATTPPAQTAPPEATTPPAGSYVAYVTSANGKSVNMRSGAGSGYSRIGSYAVGTQVTVLGTKNEWSNIIVNGKKGWMMTQYLTRVSPDAPVQPTEAPTPTPTQPTEAPTPTPTQPTEAPTPTPTQPTEAPTPTPTQPTEAPTPTPTQPTDAPTPTPDATVPGSYIAYVTSDNGGTVNMRKSASKSASIVAKLPVGTQVTVLQQSGEWYYICYGETYGYMMTDFLTYLAPGEPLPPSYTAYVMSTDGKSVNVRKGAGDQYGIVTSLPTNTEVLVLARWNDAWCKISVNGKEGFIMTQYLTTVSPNPPKEIVSVTLSNASPVVGETLSAIFVPAEAEATYAWYNANGLISTAPQYTITEADVGSMIYLTATGTGAYTGQVTSGFATPVAVPVTPPGEKIQLTGINLNLVQPPYVNQTLTAVLEPANATATFRWWRWDGTELSTSSTYTVQAADEGQCIYVSAIGTGNTEGAIAITTPNVRLWPMEELQTFSATVSIHETATYNYVLDATVTNSNFSSYTYHWYLDDVEISTEKTVRLTKDMLGKQVVLHVRPVVGYGYIGEAVSNPCTVVGFD